GGLTVTLASASPAFSMTADTCSGTGLGPRKPCTVTVEFAPLAVGTVSATLTASSNRTSASLVLTGTGPAAALAGWAMFRNTPSHEGWNTAETTLGPGTVGGLVETWTANAGDFLISSPAVANGIAYIGSNDGKLYAFDAVSGASLWSASTGSFINSSPAVADGIVYVGSDDGKLYAFDAMSGVEL